MERIKPNFDRSYKNPQVVPFEKGKLPPQALDLEEVVLGAPKTTSSKSKA